MLTKEYYNDFFEIGQQKINFSFFELSLPDDDPVYTLKNVMEELDFSGLLACYSDKGRTGFNPIMLYAVVTYANMRGVRAVDRIVDLCQRDLAFIWLTKGEKPQRDAFYDFKGKKLTGEVLDELNYQFMRRLEKEGLEFVFGKGKHKPEIQKLYEELEECGTRLMEYMEGSCVISGRKAKSWTDTLRLWKSMAVRTAAAVSINPDACINTMLKKIRTGIRS